MERSVTKRVLITGGASGLGKSLATYFLSQGHHVCIVDVNDERGKQALESFSATGTQGEVFFQRCDVTKADDLQAAVNAVTDRWGGLDVMVNNAGVAGGGPFDWVSNEDWQWIMDINFFGVLRGCQAAVPIMKEQGSGHIVNIASMAGLLNPPGMSSYNISKAAVVSLSETLVAELEPFGIGVTCVCPSFFKTNLGESMRSPDESTSDNLAKLMDNSDELSAEDIAKMIHDAVQNKGFLLMPHDKARAAWEYKQQDLDGHLKIQLKLARSVKDRAKPKSRP